MPIMTERRKHKRYTLAYPLESRKSYERKRLDLVDLSKGGIAFTAPERVSENEKVDIQIFLKERMFDLKAVVVHARKIKENIYAIGARFFNAPEDFRAILDKEVEEITQLHRENNLYNRKNLSFRKVSREYLRNTPPSKA
ncbi:MAG: hypothetical protein GF409_06660 [Candidatus Omnitrophica bacterium]|nr:hypothetical protein [Candidatus Omnitrophota bacterium]